nr:PREDICTED: uncharacterized protein LOC107398527 isoform X2 [Tribolium castaneum]|eukprot:XP_015838341.1 PREDICTED: uncharacterized protein LOC107398527 isoform X2 [Tribolium castaneum]
MNVSWLINVLFNEFLMLYYFEKILEQKQLIGELISENNRFCNRKELILIYLKFGHEPPFMVCGLFPLNCTLIFSMIAGVATQIIYLFQFIQKKDLENYLY